MAKNKFEYITSPVGKIMFMALKKPVKDLSSKDGDEGKYTLRLEFDETNEGVEAFRNTIESINEGIIVTTEKVDGKKKNLPDGVFRINFKSNFPVKVIDSTGDELTDIPYFGSGDTGTAMVTFKAVHREGNKGSLYLTSAALLELELAPRETTVEFGDTAQLLAKIKEQAAKTIS